MLADQFQKEVKKNVGFNSSFRTNPNYIPIPINVLKSCIDGANVCINLLIESLHEKRKYTNISETISSATQQRQEAAKPGGFSKMTDKCQMEVKRC